MKTIVAVLCTMISTSICCSQPQSKSVKRNENSIQKLEKCLAQKDFFRFSSMLRNNPKIDKIFRKYFEAFEANYSNDINKSIALCEGLLNKNQQHFSNDQILKLKQLNSNNYIRIFEYQKAYLLLKEVASYYKSIAATEQLTDTENTMAILSNLLTCPKQITTKLSHCQIKYSKDLAGLYTIPVSADALPDNFVFDSGANFSVISESNAKRWNMQLGNTYFSVKAISGKNVQARTGVLEKMNIENIEIKNIVFLVFPDEALQFANGKYKIHGILGFPVMEQLGEITICKDGYMHIPKEPSSIAFSNLAIDEFTPVINMETHGKQLPFTFDTGASTTRLNKIYFDSFQEDVIKQAQPTNFEVTGVSGPNTVSGYKLKSWSGTIAYSDFELHNVEVKTTALKDDDLYFYGNIGQDVIKQFDELTINFKYMYVTLLKNE